MSDDLRIAPATESDVPLILSFIRKLAEYEKLSHLVVATEENIREHVFGANPVAEVLLAYWDQKPVGFALYFRNFSTFLGQAGIYLEDLFVEPDASRKRNREGAADATGEDCSGAGLRTLGVGGARLEHAVHRVLSQPGRGSAGRMDRVSIDRRSACTAGGEPRP